MKEFSIVIPTHNRKSSILRLLELLEAQDTGDIQFSVTVVVDGSTDGTQEGIRSRFSLVHIIEGDGNWWWTRSVNEGCKHALKNGTEAILLLNDDVVLTPGYLRNIANAAGQEPGAVIGSLNVTNEADTRIFFAGSPGYNWWTGRLRRYLRFLKPVPTGLTGIYPSVVMPGRGLLIPSGVFDKIGFFDEVGLPQYKADYDFVLRAHENGIKTLISWDAVILNDVAETGKGATFKRQNGLAFAGSLLKDKTRTNLKENFLYYRRHYPASRLFFLPITAALILFRQFFLFFKDRKY